MKKPFFKLAFFVIFSLLSYACSKTSELNNNKINNQKLDNILLCENNKNRLPPGVSGKIYHASWSEWGRTSQNCKSWGLCNYTDCWFCCINDETGQIVDCNTGNPIKNYGTIYYDDNIGIGKMLIEMNPEYADHQIAITGKLTLYIDNDIYGDKFILLKGEYSLNTEIGKFGGYVINVSIIDK